MIEPKFFLVLLLLTKLASYGEMILGSIGRIWSLTFDWERAEEGKWQEVII